jgi:hypothetical protein
MTFRGGSLVPLRDSKRDARLLTLTQLTKFADIPESRSYER